MDRSVTKKSTFGDIYKLKLHESTYVLNFEVTRVPNGFLYRRWNSEKQVYNDIDVFIPTKKRLPK